MGTILLDFSVLGVISFPYLLERLTSTSCSMKSISSHLRATASPVLRPVKKLRARKFLNHSSLALDINNFIISVPNGLAPP